MARQSQSEVEKIFVDGFVDRGFILPVAAICCVVTIVIHFVRLSRPRLLKEIYIAGLDGGRRTIAEARQHFVTNCRELLIEGYRETNGGFYYVPSPAGERLMIPTKYIEELKNASDDQVDFNGSFLEMFLGDYTTIGKRWHLHPGIVKRDLNSNLNEISPSVEEELRDAFDELMPECEDWTPVPLQDLFNEMISRASNRMLGGKALSRNKEWTSTSIDFTADASIAAERLKQYHAFLRPIAQYRIPEMKKLAHHREVARKVVVPIIKQRLEQQKIHGTSWEKPVDLLQMLWDGAQGQDKTPEFMSYTALVISFAAVRTSSSVPTHVLYDLCARSMYIAPLRKEIEDVLAAEGSFSKAALNKLVKLDSFMKEVQRNNPITFITFGRLIRQDLTLKDGFVIPKGTLMAVPAHAVGQNQTFFPGEFSGFRFVKDAREQKSESSASFVTTNQQNLSWGYGKHACSGRFFAANEIKMLIAFFITRYDFKFGGGRTERPLNLDFELQSIADPRIEVLIKKRK